MSDKFSDPYLASVLVTNVSVGGYAGITSSVVLQIGETHTFTGASQIAALKASYDAVGSNMPAWDTAGKVTFVETADTNVVAGADVRTIGAKKAVVMIGAPGVTGCDFNFASAANKTAQNLDLGNLIPAQSDVTGARFKCKVIPDGAFSLAGYTLVTLTQLAPVIAAKTIAFDLKVTPVATGVTVTTPISQVFTVDQATTAAAIKALIDPVVGIGTVTLSGSDLVYEIPASAGYTVEVANITVTGAYTTFTNVGTLPANDIAFTFGTTSGGNNLGASAVCSTVNSFTGVTADPTLALSNSAVKAWVGATPALTNWALFTKGKWEAMIEYTPFDA